MEYFILVLLIAAIVTSMRLRARGIVPEDYMEEVWCVTKTIIIMPIYGAAILCVFLSSVLVDFISKER